MPFSKFMERPKTQFHADTMRDPKLLRQIKSNLIIRSQFCCSTVLFFYLSIFYWRYNKGYCFPFASLVKILMHHSIFATFGEILLFCPLLGDWKYARCGSTWCWSITMYSRTFPVTSDFLTQDTSLACFD